MTEAIEVTSGFGALSFGVIGAFIGVSVGGIVGGVLAGILLAMFGDSVEEEVIALRELRHRTESV